MSHSTLGLYSAPLFLMRQWDQEGLLKHRSEVLGPTCKNDLLPLQWGWSWASEFACLPNSQLMLKLLAHTPHFDAPRPQSTPSPLLVLKF